MLDNEISIAKVIAIIFDTYGIVNFGQAIPLSALTVDGIEKLVTDNYLPRTAATIIYKLMMLELNAKDETEIVDMNHINL